MPWPLPLVSWECPSGLGRTMGVLPGGCWRSGWHWLTGLVPWGLAVWLWCKRTQVPWLVRRSGACWWPASLPVLGLVPFAFQAYSTVADRYMYIAMLGPALALAWGLAQVRQRWLAVGGVVLLGSSGDTQRLAGTLLARYHSRYSNMSWLSIRGVLWPTVPWA